MVVLLALWLLAGRPNESPAEKATKTIIHAAGSTQAPTVSTNWQLLWEDVSGAWSQRLTSRTG